MVAIAVVEVADQSRYRLQRRSGVVGQRSEHLAALCETGAGDPQVFKRLGDRLAVRFVQNFEQVVTDLIQALQQFRRLRVNLLQIIAARPDDRIVLPLPCDERRGIFAAAADLDRRDAAQDVRVDTGGGVGLDLLCRLALDLDLDLDLLAVVRIDLDRGDMTDRDAGILHRRTYGQATDDPGEIDV